MQEVPACKRPSILLALPPMDAGSSVSSPNLHIDVTVGMVTAAVQVGDDITAPSMKAPSPANDPVVLVSDAPNVDAVSREPVIAVAPAACAMQVAERPFGVLEPTAASSDCDLQHSPLGVAGTGDDARPLVLMPPPGAVDVVAHVHDDYAGEVNAANEAPLVAPSAGPASPLHDQAARLDPVKAFLGLVAEPISPSLLRGPIFKPIAVPNRGATPDSELLRRSRRLANRPPEMQGTSISNAKRLVCRRLGIEFEEPVADPADLLARYADCFKAPLSATQIQALTELASNACGSKRWRKEALV